MVHRIEVKSRISDTRADSIKKGIESQGFSGKIKV